MNGCSCICRRMANVILTSFFSALLLLVPVMSATPPYVQSHILLPAQHNESLAYLLLSDHPGKRIQFLSLNLSTGIDVANPQYSVLFDRVPFFEDERSSFIPTVDDQGIIRVYAGNCRSLDHAAIWQFSPLYSSSVGNGTWDRQPVLRSTSITSQSLYGPSFLAGAFTYTPSKALPYSIYAFGGMCPSNNDSAQDWTSAAKYSQTMTLLDPLSSVSSASYSIAVVGNRAPPISEAGFTMTPLYPAYMANIAGAALRQQEVLLIGGHTSRAFINMSELAVFSVPQNSWSFITVESEPSPEKLVPGVSNTLIIEPRSGHSAVLTADGTKVVIFGGWVGETSVPAEPQLAILDIGEEYGGTGLWKWRVPRAVGTPLAKGEGIYGHGATMLSGGVMMIAGGYRIPQSTKRSIMPNPLVYLYNVTSNSWIKSYANPLTQAPRKSRLHTDVLSTGQRAGLGIGLGLGLPLTIGTILFCWLLKRRRRAHQIGGKHTQKLAHGAEKSQFLVQKEQHLTDRLYQLQMKQIGSVDPSTGRAGPYAGRYLTTPENGEIMESAGLLVDIPTARDIQQNFSANSNRLPGCDNEFQERDQAGSIYLVGEREGCEHYTIPTRRQDLQCADLSDTTDPFTDTPFLTPRSTSFMPILCIPRDSSRFTPSYGLRALDSCSLPEKDSCPPSDTTSSPASSALVKSVHQFRATAFGPAFSLPTFGRQPSEKLSTVPTFSRERDYNDVGRAVAPAEKRISADTFSTALTTLERQQTENDHLLTSRRGLYIQQGLASKHSRTPDWAGSIRRVLGASSGSSAAGAEPSFAPIASGIDRRSTALCPFRPANRSGMEPELPRRTVSASAGLSRPRQEMRYRGVSKAAPRILMLDNNDSVVVPYEEDKEDWGAERAVNGRCVQLTFTVPKERLRVVNFTEGDIDALSEKSISRGSSRSIRRAASR